MTRISHSVSAGASEALRLNEAHDRQQAHQHLKAHERERDAVDDLVEPHAAVDMRIARGN